MMRKPALSSLALALTGVVVIACSSKDSSPAASSSTSSSGGPGGDAAVGGDGGPNGGDGGGGGGDASSDAGGLGCPSESRDGCVKGTLSMQLGGCHGVPANGTWTSTVSLGAGDEGSCLYYPAQGAVPAFVDLTMQHPVGSKLPDAVLLRIVDFKGAGTYDVNDLKAGDGTVDVRFQVTGQGGEGGATSTTAASAAQGCPACKVTVNAANASVPAGPGTFADYDMTIVCGGELGLGQGDAGQTASDTMTCSQTPATFGTCTVTSQSTSLKARCRGH